MYVYCIGLYCFQKCTWIVAYLVDVESIVIGFKCVLLSATVVTSLLSLQEQRIELESNAVRRKLILICRVGRFGWLANQLLIDQLINQRPRAAAAADVSFLLQTESDVVLCVLTRFRAYAFAAFWSAAYLLDARKRLRSDCAQAVYIYTYICLYMHNLHIYTTYIPYIYHVYIIYIYHINIYLYTHIRDDLGATSVFPIPTLVERFHYYSYTSASNKL